MTDIATEKGLPVTAGSPRGRIFGTLNEVSWSPSRGEWEATITPDLGGRLEVVPITFVTPLAEWDAR